jgi:hypothetical protein
LLLAVGFASCSTAGAQSPFVIDAAHLTSVVDLDAPWSYHAGNDLRWADPAFDDTAWPKIRPSQTFAAAGIPEPKDAHSWVRLHVHIVHAAEPLALAIVPSDLKATFRRPQFELFANGQRIGSSPSWASGVLANDPTVAVVLPPGTDIVLAVHFNAGPYRLRDLPAARVRIGYTGPLRDSLTLGRVQFFDRTTLGPIAWLMSYAFTSFFFVALFIAQRKRVEYLWLALYCLSVALVAIHFAAENLGWEPSNSAALDAARFVYLMPILLNLEFIVAFTGSRRKWPLRAFEGALIGCMPFFSLFGGAAWGATEVASEFLWFACVVYYLTTAYRQGQAESGMLIGPTAAAIAAIVLYVAGTVFPAAIPIATTYHFGPVGITLLDVGAFLYLLGIVAVVLYRFIRVEREQQRTAGEMAAAREVQQRLVPAKLPAIEGWSIAAAYLPAAEVGGDFYQVLSQADGPALIVVGDVSGKGLKAAMTGALALGALRALAASGYGPADLLFHLNEQMAHSEHDGFITLICVRLSPGGAMTVANAGHLQPYHNGRELPLDCGLPLGMVAGTIYTEATFQLAPGDTLTLMSDGVVEARKPGGELFGFERAQSISNHIAGSIAEAAQTFGQEDDITVLTLRLNSASVPA